MEHEIKIWPKFFQPILSGEKTFELRKDDRGYKVGDVLNLREWKRTARYTGRTYKVIISHILRGFGLKPGWIVMAIKPYSKSLIAPWPDYKGNEIREGDIIIHPSGENGVVKFHPERSEVTNQWTVNYGGYLESRLCLQIGNKGQAVVFRR